MTICQEYFAGHAAIIASHHWNCGGALWMVLPKLWDSTYDFKVKVEKILTGSMDSIPSPSPSAKTQIMGVEVCLRCKGKTLLGIC